MTTTAQGHLAMLLFSLLVAGSFPFGAMVAPHVDAAALTALRMALAAVLLGGIAFARGEATLSVLKAPWRAALLAALYAFYFTTMFSALGMTTPVSLAAVFTLSPFLAAIIGYLLLRQVTTGWMALAIGVGAIGALWVIFDGSLSALLGVALGRGEILYFVGCVGHAFLPPLLRLLNRGEPATAFVASIFAWGAVLLTIWSWPELRATNWLAVPPVVWVALAYTGVLTTALSFSLMRFAALHLPSAKVLAYTYLIPTWVILWELALGRGVPHWSLLPGVGLTIAALVMLLRNEDRHGPVTRAA